MERRHGVVIRKSLPPAFQLTPEVADALCRGMVTTLATLHRIDYRAIGLEGFGKPDGYIGRQVKGWTDRYLAAETDQLPDIDAVAGWLAAHQPPECGAAVIHNDYKFDNVILDPLDPGKVVAVLDWEMATVGDPLMDLGTALSYWLEPGDPHIIPGFEMGPTTAPGMWSRRRMVDEYARLSPIGFGDLNFYFVFGIFKLAVVLQQIYGRYARGATKDERFATMNRMVAILARGAAAAAERGTL
jgi:aminoglycoside phosphotransferase (APT) family kinase protein